ncbi:ankyrin repeat domain-containing protein [Roseospira navarrensis]|uniref:Ankyrin repeat domain-containing protein n=2 Tax=Roseospira navarrensis TaxID=140058 RepID=A0A7X1ZGD3_9PROT|nr:ankyrin repeat domain-containing protein [Roseospira navarrensis]
MDALRQALGDPPGFPNAMGQHEPALGESVLGYALAWSPVPFVRRLLAMGADPSAPADDGFPPLHTVLSLDRPDRLERLRLLLAAGADPDQRGLNDWTPLHHAVWNRDREALRLLLDHGADPSLAVRLDDFTTPLEDAEALGLTDMAETLRAAAPRTHRKACDD